MNIYEHIYLNIYIKTVRKIKIEMSFNQPMNCLGCVMAAMGKNWGSQSESSSAREREENNGKYMWEMNDGGESSMAASVQK